MERKVNRMIDAAFTNYKEHIKKGIIETVSTINGGIDHTTSHNIVCPEKIKANVHESLMSLLQELYDYEVLQLNKVDFQKRKRVKNVVPLHDRCTAVRANGEQCSRRKKGELEFCGTHSKGTPHGVVSHSDNVLDNSVKTKKVTVWAQDIQGIIYYIDDNNNVYDTGAVATNKENPQVIATYTKSIGADGNQVFSIPEFKI